MNPGADAVPRWMVVVAALLGLTGVVAGAFGAHGLDGAVAPDRLSAFETGARYQVFHALALLAVGVLAGQGLAGRWLTASALCFTVGVGLFSGSLYGLVLLNWAFLGPITPLGGLLLMAGWLLLAVAALTSQSHSGGERR
ncbi:hypothetical protein CF392_09435 [Tamilnaduibacter salinus]|uniref:DUF423 domain-containing protein n=1 Tax=Tamilnaduibacter salinus TaxID=1484056 RepID=A0A2A2I136_9GAMM|nr:DUF423 domain-containing protein [Tamilnaduibacter salinus]PAV25741.1 hypothetical protein CF392_09435 [Tamilnaduibacter salinus]